MASSDESGPDYLVTVCAECKTACCWHGEMYCYNSKGADVVDLPASELRTLKLEHPDNYSREQIERITGSPPEEVAP